MPGRGLRLPPLLAAVVLFFALPALAGGPAEAQIRRSGRAAALAFLIDFTDGLRGQLADGRDQAAAWVRGAVPRLLRKNAPPGGELTWFGLAGLEPGHPGRPDIVGRTVLKGLLAAAKPRTKVFLVQNKNGARLGRYFFVLKPAKTCLACHAEAAGRAVLGLIEARLPLAGFDQPAGPAGP